MGMAGGVGMGTGGTTGDVGGLDWADGWGFKWRKVRVCGDFRDGLLHVVGLFYVFIGKGPSGPFPQCLL